jgi:hypothetical protein
MKKTIFVIGGIALLSLMAFFLFSDNSVEGIPVDMYKSISCGCCVGHASYMNGKGFNVNKIELQDLTSIKEKYNIPKNMQSCHTEIIEGYFVEGHVPIEAINKLLGERPNIKGIALPGMPSGSPGMPGTKNEDWIIYSQDLEGNWEEWMRI